MNTVCDHQSVGILITDAKTGELLIMNRAKYPFGWAPPAGHIDQHGSPEDAAKQEVLEEVGLTVTSLKLVHHSTFRNRCRRGGSWHEWYVYEAVIEGEIQVNPDEVLAVKWVKVSELIELATRAAWYKMGYIQEEEWRKNPGLEPVWFEILLNLERLRKAP